jgi:hypothetical protein
VDCFFQFWRQYSLFCHQTNCIFFFGDKRLLVGICLIKQTKLGIGGSVSHLFTITSDKRDRISFINQGNNGLNHGRSQSCFGLEDRSYIKHKTTSRIKTLINIVFLVLDARAKNEGLEIMVEKQKFF